MKTFRPLGGCARRGFTLIELMVVVAIIALLISILLPSLGAAKEAGRKLKCQANLKQIGNAVQFYLNDNDDQYPNFGVYGAGGNQSPDPADPHQVLGSRIATSDRPLSRYLQSTDVFRCPSDKGDATFGLRNFFEAHGTSYAYVGNPVYNMGGPTGTLNGYGIMPLVEAFDEGPNPANLAHPQARSTPASEVQMPVRKIVFHEPPLNPEFTTNVGKTFEQAREAHWHSAVRPHSNALFADGHVEFIYINPDLAAQPNAAPDPRNGYY